MSSASEAKSTAESLTTRLFATVLVFAAILTGAYLTLVHLPLYDSLKTLNESEGRQLFGEISTRIQNQVEQAVTELQDLASRDPMRQMNPSEMDRILAIPADGENERFVAFMVQDKDGRIVSQPAQPQAVGTSLAHRLTFSVPFEDGVIGIGKARFSQALGSPVTFGIGVPIDGPNGDRVGVLTGHARVCGSVTTLRTALFEDVNLDNYHAILLDHDGIAIADTDIVIERMRDTNSPRHPMFTGQVDSLRAQYYKYNATDYLGFARRVPGTNLILILEGRVGQAIQAAELVVNVVTWLLISLVVVMLIGAWLYVSRIMRPTNILTSGLVDFGEKGEARTLDAKGTQGQVGKAIDAFHGMLGERMLYETELVRHRKEMQDLVIEFVNVKRLTRHEIAHDFHADVAESLTAANAQLEILRNRQTSEAREESLKTTVDLLRLCMNRTKAMTEKLTNPTLSQQGLVSALRELTALYQGNFAMKVEFRVDDAELGFELDEGVTETLFMGVRDLLRNIATNVRAQKASVHIRRRDNMLEIEVRDDGVRHGGPGLDASEVEFERFGKVGFPERIRQLGGTVTVESETGRSSIVTIAVPLDSVA